MSVHSFEELRRGPRGPSSRHPRPRRRWARRALAAGLGLVVLTGAAAAAAWPLTPSVGDAERRVQSRLAEHHALLLRALPSPDRVGQAVVATEDSRFFSHWGVDAVGVLRAALHVASPGDAGGATLDQQLAKNLWTGNAGVLVKVEQVELSLKLEAAYSKRQLLRFYLAMAYFGHGYYGLPAATEGYFGVPPDRVSWAQASLLAGLVQAPTAYDPYRHLDRAKLRQRHVLDRLVATRVLTRADADEAFRAALSLR